MNKIGTLIQILYWDERRVAEAMAELADRHSDDHEICDVARELSRWSVRHGEKLRAIGPRYDVELRSEASGGRTPSLLEPARADLPRPVDQVDEGMLLLRELRQVHLACVGLSVDWEIVAQAAKALRDEDLETVATQSQAEAVRQLKWTNAKIKESAPQVMAS